MDFSCAKYISLLSALKNVGYFFQTFEEYINNPAKKVLILRHDIDKRMENALKFAEIEASMNIKASYHFRIHETRKNPAILIKIKNLGHEIAYHYEDLSKISRNGLIDEDILQNALTAFRNNLSFLRQYYPVRVISMHGDPTSLTDNRSLWQTFSYKQEGIICEPYYDIDYSSVLYLTDTGRTWNNKKINVRDKIDSGTGITTGKPLNDFFAFNNTDDIIFAAKSDSLPNAIIINTHPQRWNDNFFPWITELFIQKVKNCLKYMIILYRNFKKKAKE